MSDTQQKNTDTFSNEVEGDETDYFASFEENANDDDFTPEPAETPELPLFPFHQEPVITLKNGTKHYFNRPTDQNEKTKENLMKTLILTSPAKINGQNPRKIKTDYSKAMLRYYLDTVKSVQGFAFNEGDDPNEILDARKVVDEGVDNNGKTFKKILAQTIPTSIAKAAAERVYGGKIEIVKPETKPGEKTVVVLNTRRRIHVRQEIGVETNDDGSLTPPTHVIDYYLVEPESKHLSKWEMQCSGGYQLNLPDGGSKEERVYLLNECCALFDSMIDEIIGGSVDDNGTPCDAKNSDHLAIVHKSIKKLIIAHVMNDQTLNAGN